MCLYLWKWCCIPIIFLPFTACFFSPFPYDTYVFLFLTQDWNKCSVGCEFGFSASKTPDATFGIAPDPSVDSILRSMESSQYYSENNIDVARGWVRTKLILIGDFMQHSLPV
jgi:hypothetical protein